MSILCMRRKKSALSKIGAAVRFAGPSQRRTPGSICIGWSGRRDCLRNVGCPANECYVPRNTIRPRVKCRRLGFVRRRWNIRIWAGFAIVLLAVVSYIPVFSLFPVTRDFPWVNLLLFVVGIGLLAAGLKRAFREPVLYRGKIVGSILAGLSLSMFGLFCFGVFFASKNIPSAGSALRVGQTAPDFTLASAEGKPVALSDLLKSNRAVALIFYRGYW